MYGGHWMGYKLMFTEQAEKDARNLEERGLDRRAKELLKIIKENPYQNPPPYEKLVGELKETFSRRINIQHRLIYTVLKEEKAIKVIRLCTHYQ